MSKLTASELVADSPIDIQATLPEFAKAWHDTVTSLFRMLELIQKHQNRPGFERLCDALDDRGIIKRSVMSMLRRITSNPVLMASEHRGLLPPSYNTLWTLTGLKEEVLEAKIAKKELTAATTLETARQWKRDLSAPKGRRKGKVRALYATLKVDNVPRVKANSTKIQKCLDQIGKLGLVVEMDSKFK